MQNEKTLPYPRSPDRDSADLCALPGAGRCPHRADHGRCATNFLLPCAFGLDGIHPILHQFRSFDFLSHQAQSDGRHRGPGHGRSRRRFLHRRPRYGPDLGASGLGYLVDVGHAPDLDPRSVAHLCELSFSAPLFYRRRDAFAGRRACGSGRAVRAVCLLLDLVLPHPASATGHGRRRIDRSAHVACAARQLAGFFLLCFFGLLVALSIGKAAARSRSRPCHGIVVGSTREGAMNKTYYLVAAYAVTWIIHITYLGTIVRRYSRLKREIEELKKPGVRS